MIRINQIKLENDGNTIMDSVRLRSALIKRAAKLLRISEGDITKLEIIRHSVDARKKPKLFDVYMIDIEVKGADEQKLVKRRGNKNIAVVTKKEYSFEERAFEKGKSDNPDKFKIVVIGSGPAGLFCAYELARAGFCPIVLERGQDVDTRRRSVEHFWETGELDTHTNVQFGEGGAGTFSDGKLNTMVKDKDGRGREALNIFVRHGAPDNILYEAKPHIGTDILCNVVKSIRNEIISFGGKVIFDAQVKELVITQGRLSAVRTDDGTYECDAAVLAIGHSARDTFYMLNSVGADMQKKPFAVGFRVEHKQELINLSQYGIAAPAGLPAAAYKLVTTTKSGRGVYSFCMCPGGYVVNASSEEGMLAVNGMSYSGRDGLNANSAIIITINPEDFGSEDVLSGVEFQRRLEKKAYEIGGGKIPVERYGDFKVAVISNNSDYAKLQDEEHKEDFAQSVQPQMKGDYIFANVHEILPDNLNVAFVEGMESFGKMIQGYNKPDTIISGIESRTSSPVRITRDENGESTSIKGLFPCGEGAGYAGGIMSAAMDGIRIAELVAKRASSNDKG